MGVLRDLEDWGKQNIVNPIASLGGSIQKEIGTDIFNMDDLSYQGGVADVRDAPPPVQVPDWTDMYGQVHTGQKPVFGSEAAERNYGSGIGIGEGTNLLGQGLDTMWAKRVGFTPGVDPDQLPDSTAWPLNTDTNLWEITPEERLRLEAIGVDPNVHPMHFEMPEIYGNDVTDAERAAFNSQHNVYGIDGTDATPLDPAASTAETGGPVAETTGTGINTTQLDLLNQSYGGALTNFNRNLFDPSTGQLAELERKAPTNFNALVPDNPLLAKALGEAETGYDQSQLNNLYGLQAGMGLINYGQQDALTTKTWLVVWPVVRRVTDGTSEGTGRWSGRESTTTPQTGWCP